MKNTTNNNGGLPKAPQAVPPPRKRSVKTVIWLVLGALLLVVIAGLVYQRQQSDKRAEAAYQADKASFAQVEKDMAAAYAQMTATDKPVKEEYSRQCSRISQKLNDGPIVCSVTYALSYAPNSYDQTINRAVRFEQSLKAQNFVTINGSSVTEISSSDPNFGSLLGGWTDYKISSFDGGCKVELTQIGSSFKFDPGSESTYLFECSKFADKPVYQFLE